MTTCSRRHPETDLFATKIYAREYENESWTHLASAAASGHVELVKKYLKEQQHTPIEAQVHFGWFDFPNPTPLILAAGHGHLDCVRLLMDGEVLATTKTGQTALMAAAASCYLDVVYELLDREAGKKDDNGWTALMYAADRGCAPVCKVLAKLEGNCRSVRSETALLLAAAANKKDVVEVLAPYEATESGLLAMELTTDEEIRAIIAKHLPEYEARLIAENKEEFHTH